VALLLMRKGRSQPRRKEELGLENGQEGRESEEKNGKGKDRSKENRRTFVPLTCASLTLGSLIVSNALNALGMSSGFPPERARQTARAAPSSIA
jgi:hypothetical protein